MFGSFFLAVVTAVPIGIAMGMSRLARGVFDPPIEFYRPIPPLACLPLTIIWFGIGEFGKLFLISPSAQDKARRKRTASGESVHSFRTLLDDLVTIAENRVVVPLADAQPFDLITRPTALQRKAFRLLGVRLERTQ